MNDVPPPAADPVAFAPTVRILHLSDVHFGRHFVPSHVAAAEALAVAQPLNAIVVSGDVSQRAREREFRDARAWIERLRAIAPVCVVPGNHDTAWWHAPFGLGEFARLHALYRHYISDQLEPTLRIPGVTIVGLNSAAGTFVQAMTWYPRDWRVKGGLTDAQLTDASRRLAESPRDDLRLLVLHHNVLRGRLSQRWGLTRPHESLGRIAAARPHVVCTGHDHEERIEIVTHAAGRFLVSGANTLSRRVRGHRASALNVIEADARSVRATAWVFDGNGFSPGPMSAMFPRRDN